MSRLLIGDCRESMRQLIAEGVKVQMCVTSPPYWGLRDYGVAGQLGLEPTIQEYVANMVEVFRLVRELLADDGTLWLNFGDSYARAGGWSNNNGLDGVATRQESDRAMSNMAADGGASQKLAQGLKSKDLCGIPWRVAFALQADGWWLRQDIIWAKPNPMPESVTDRCTKAHEHLFLIAKSERYYYDAEAIAEEMTESSVDRLLQPGLAMQGGSMRVPGKTNGPMKAVGHLSAHMEGTQRNDGDMWRLADRGVAPRGTRNKRSVWTVATHPYSEAHFATFPPKLIEPCILAGSRPGDIVFDPFFGSGTTGEVAQRLGRQWIGCELNPAYEKLGADRTRQTGMVLT